MQRDHPATRIIFATGMIAMAILGFVYGDFALEYQPVPASTPFRTELAYVAAVLMLVCGIGLLFRRTTPLATRILFPYLIVWTLFEIPAFLAAPQIEGSWLGLGEIVVLLTGGWVLFAIFADIGERSPFYVLTGAGSVRIAQLVFALALLPIGLSHLVYVRETVSLVPGLLPFKKGWAYLTGIGQIAAGLGVLTSVLPRIAATAEAVMITLFTFLVWVPVIVAKPGSRGSWTALAISWAIAAGAWVVAGSIGVRTRLDSEVRAVDATG